MANTKINEWNEEILAILFSCSFCDLTFTSLVMMNFDLSQNFLQYIDVFLHFDFFQLRRHALIVLEATHDHESLV